MQDTEQSKNSQPEKLKVGDKVYQKSYSRWENSVYFIFETVERLTPTQAILSNGIRLLNVPKRGFGENGGIEFGEKSDRWRKWKLQTPEILEEARIENERQQIAKWFDNQKFTDEQKRIVFERFKELNLIEEKEN